MLRIARLQAEVEQVLLQGRALGLTEGEAQSILISVNEEAKGRLDWGTVEQRMEETKRRIIEEALEKRHGL